MPKRLAARNWSEINVARFARDKNLFWLLRAKKWAEMFYEGMYRIDGREEVIHSLKVCQILIFFGIWDDETLAAAFLHDVLENVSKNAIDLLRPNFSKRIVALVEILTKTDEMSVKEYCRLIGNDSFAVLIKLADRIQNLRNMIKNLNSEELTTKKAKEFFVESRLEEQVQETADFIIKLPYLAIFRERDAPSNCPLDYFRIMDLMTRELKQTIHVARVILSELVV